MEAGRRKRDGSSCSVSKLLLHREESRQQYGVFMRRLGKTTAGGARRGVLAGQYALINYGWSGATLEMVLGESEREHVGLFPYWNWS